MGKFQQLLIVEVAAIAALALFGGAMAAVAASDSASNAAAILGPGSAAWITFAYTCILGAVPVIAFGAPGYWILLQRGMANWYYALALGAAPAMAFLLVDLNLAFWALIAGSIVALLTHALCRRLGPNHSSRPTPLRGAAQLRR